MAKPRQLENGKWRIRWTDHEGNRQSQVFSKKEDAEFRLKTELLNTERITRGLTEGIVPISFDGLCDKWLLLKTPGKRKPKDDISIITEIGG